MGTKQRCISEHNNLDHKSFIIIHAINIRLSFKGHSTLILKIKRNKEVYYSENCSDSNVLFSELRSK